MTSYRLSGAARDDLIAIAKFGDEQFGLEQSNRYRDQLTRHFSLLAEKSLLFPSVDHIRSGYRRSVCGSHSVYCRVTSDGVEIMRLIGRQNFPKEPPAEQI